MSLPDRAADAIDRLHARIGQAASWLVLLMVAIGAFNAVGRYAGRGLGVSLSSNAWLEAQWYLFSLVFLLGAADALRRDAHVRVDVLYGRFAPRTRAAVELAGTLLLLLPFCVFGVVVSVPSVAASWSVWETSPDPGGLPRWPLKTMVPVAFVLLGLQGVAVAVRTARSLRDTERP